MKAIRFTKYGSPDVLQLQEVEKPLPTENRILVKVHAASANPLDWHRMRGAPFLVRLSEGMFKPKNPKLGADVAGRVEAVGSDVTKFKPGDEVFGAIGVSAFSEYVCARETAFALKPANISFEDAAAVPVGALTALQCLRDAGQIQAGQSVLINGASGGVGTYAVQIAKHFGAQVTGVCSARNLEMVRSIGADHVIDYTRENYTRTGGRYDIILDNIGNHSPSANRRVLAPDGRYVLAGFASMFGLIQVILLGAVISKLSRQKIGFKLSDANEADLVFLQNLLATGKIRSVIDRCYPLNETAEAIRYLETGRARGKVIITVTP